ncbi:golgin subfamily A member 6-like protein 24 [Sardina pilchardus]|uniref:golgin subfamily A member 6-like protein 24 n=1 Tax=Sardina pilchardus TaxID=27697 RepID=UPI002E1085E7
MEKEKDAEVKEEDKKLNDKQLEDKEKGEKKIEREKDIEVKEGKELNDEPLIEEKEEGVNTKGKEGQEEVTECVVEIKEKNVEDTGMATALVTKTVSSDLAQNGNQEKEEEKAAEKDMMRKDEKKERVEDDKEVDIKEKEELAEVQEEKKAEDMKVKEEQEKVEIMVERKQKQVDITDGTVAMEMRPEVSLMEDGKELMDNKGKEDEKKKAKEKEDMKVQEEQEEVKECVLEVEEKEKEDTDDGTVAVETTLKVSLESNTTINQEQQVKKRMPGCQGDKSKNKHDKHQVHNEVTEENRPKQHMRYGQQHESQHRIGERRGTRQGVRGCWRDSNGCQTGPVGCWGDAKRCWKGPMAHEEEKEKQGMSLKEAQEEVKQCVEDGEEKEEENVFNRTVTMGTTLKIHLVIDRNTTTNEDQEVKKRTRGCRGGKSKNKQQYNDMTEENKRRQGTKAGHQHEFEHQNRGVERQNKTEGVQANWKGPQQEERQTREDNQKQTRNKHRYNMAARREWYAADACGRHTEETARSDEKKRPHGSHGGIHWNKGGLVVERRGPVWAEHKNREGGQTQQEERGERMGERQGPHHHRERREHMKRRDTGRGIGGE